jgi:hypothetical protein
MMESLVQMMFVSRVLALTQCEMTAVVSRKLMTCSVFLINIVSHYTVLCPICVTYALR